MKKTLTILVPVKNEEKALPALLASLNTVLEPLSDLYAAHVLIVDDGSEDQTVQVVKNYSSEVYSIGLLSFTRNFGKEAAIAAGIDRCESDACLLMDADSQHPPELIPDMLQAWQDGNQLVECVKRSRGQESFLYKLCSKVFYTSMAKLGSMDLEQASDFKLMDKEIVLAIRNLPERNRFFRGLVGWMGYPAHRLTFEVPSREHGESSWSTWGLVKFSLSSLTSFTSAPLHIVTVIGVLMLLVSLLIGSITLYQWAIGNAVTGFTTVIILLLMIGSMLMISLGLIGLYVSKIYDEVKSRPSYVIKDSGDDSQYRDQALRAQSAKQAND